MANQAKIINAINRCLKQTFKLDFRLEQQGICAGLAGLYIKYALENKESQFLALIERLASLPQDYCLGDDSKLDDFVIQVERVFNAPLYSHLQINQQDLEKSLSIENKPLLNELNLGLIADVNAWEKIIELIACENRAYSISNHDHAIALSYRNGNYFLYDPNHNTPPKALTHKEVVQEFNRSFTDTALLGLSIRVFAHPDAKPEQYPTIDALHQLAFPEPEDADRSLVINKRFLQSSLFASKANDLETVAYLINRHHIDWDKIGGEFLNPQFSDLLLQQPIFPGLNEALLKGIIFTLGRAQFPQAQRLIEHYRHHYSSPEDDSRLKKCLEEIFQYHSDNLWSFTKENDYDAFMHSIDGLQFSADPQRVTYFNHLTLLTYLHQKKDDLTFKLFLESLSTAQLHRQIQAAATANQLPVLNRLVHYLAESGHHPNTLPAIFTETMLQKINVQALKLLLSEGFLLDLNQSQLLSVCSLRPDKSIFELFARAFSKQAKQNHVWERIDTSAYDALDLTESIGSLPVLDALIFLNKNEYIERSWKSTISPEAIEQGLTAAILVGNVQMSTFLFQKLQETQHTLAEDTLEFLYQTGVNEENLTILNSLANIHFNVLHKAEDIEKILLWCADNHDYNLIDLCLATTPSSIQQLVLKTSFKYRLTPILERLATHSPQIFNTWLNDWLAKDSSHERDEAFKRLNTYLELVPSQTLQLPSERTQRRQFIGYCFEHKLFKLSNLLLSASSLEEPELSSLLDDLIHKKYQIGIAQLISTHPRLQDPQIVTKLIHHRFIKAIGSLLGQLPLKETDISYIAAIGIAEDDKRLLDKMLSLGLISAKTLFIPSLMEKLKDAIHDGHTDVVECFVHSPIDFKLSFEELFIESCSSYQLKLANQLLEKYVPVQDEEKHLIITHLFSKQSSSSIIDTLYRYGYGRLYRMAASLDSVNFAAFAPLQRAIRENNEELFKIFFEELNLPRLPTEELLAILQDPIDTPRVLPAFIAKYGFNILLSKALEQQNWRVVGNLLEEATFSDIDPEIKPRLQDNDHLITDAFLQNLSESIPREDVRKRLFSLKVKDGPLASLAAPFKTTVESTLFEMEVKMLEQGLHLNGQVYRYAANTGHATSALTDVAQLLHRCRRLIEGEHISLEKPITNSALLIYYSQIKNLILTYDLFSSVAQLDASLLEDLNNNSRLSAVCKYEFQLYDLMKQYNFPEQPWSEFLPEDQRRITTLLNKLQEALNVAGLPETFLSPPLQLLLSTYQQSFSVLNKSGDEEGMTVEIERSRSNSGDEAEIIDEKNSVPPDKKFHRDFIQQKNTLIYSLDEYLAHRDETLGFVTYYLDYERGRIRVEHYKESIQLAKNPNELQVLVYTMLTDPIEDHYKISVAQALGFEDVSTAIKQVKDRICTTRLRKYLGALDQVIQSIQQKINDKSPTAILLSDELNAIRSMSTTKSSLAQNSLFQTEHQQKQLGLSEWVSSLLGHSIPDEHRLSFKKPMK